MPSSQESDGDAVKPSRHADSSFPFMLSTGAAITVATSGKRKFKGRQNHRMSGWQRPNATPLSLQVGGGGRGGGKQSAQASHTHLKAAAEICNVGSLDISAHVLMPGPLLGA